MITKISRNLSVTDAIKSLKQQIAVLKRQLFTKRTQASAYNEVKDNLKQNDLLIHVDYSENYNNKQQGEIQNANFGHASLVFSPLAFILKMNQMLSIKRLLL